MELNLHAAYGGMVLLGIGLVVALRPAARYTPAERRQYVRIQLITLLAAVTGAKLAVLVGDGLWPLRPFHDWQALLFSGRSIVGALLLGFVAAEACKPLLGYTLPPNDRFAMILPFSIATGRLGCWMTGCCQGIEMQGFPALRCADGVSRFPAPLVELAFHVCAGLALIALWRGQHLAGRLFSVYLVAYGVFRFVSEFWRATPKAFAGFSAYQWMALLMVVTGGVALYLRRERAAPMACPRLEHA
jgi:phosphatidylglycerol:prolipoprotein diacylglycerol transferase